MIARFYVHTVTVETFLGQTGSGTDKFAAPVVLAPPNGCLVENTLLLVRNAAGEEVVSSTQVYTFTANAALFTPDSRVTTDDGRPARVIGSSANGFGSKVDHTAVTLT